MAETGAWMSVIATDEADGDVLYGNGVDGATGKLLFSDVSAVKFAESLLQRDADDLTNRLADTEAKKREGKLAIPFPAKEGDLKTTGWGVVFAQDVGRDVKKALERLIEYRSDTVGDMVKIFDGEKCFRPGETAAEFVVRQGGDRLTMRLDKVPYYLLLVGDPEAIPYREQRYLSTQYAVGRLDLNSAQAYKNYAKAIVAHERKLRGAGSPILHLFGPRNQDDPCTPASLNYLINPLAAADFLRKDVERQALRADEATKAALIKVLASADRPRVVVTATHGVAFEPGHSQQDAMQGALLCQDWPGPKADAPVLPSHCFAAADVTAGIDAGGAFLLLNACFSGGTPRQDEFWFAAKNTVDVKTLAKRAFTAKLVRQLLGHDKPPVGILAHCDRAWGASFYRPDSSHHAAMFVALLQGVLGGRPLGAALEPINGAAATLSFDLRQYVDNREVVADKRVFVQQWIAERDARGYSLFGDPAVRLVAPQAPAKG